MTSAGRKSLKVPKRKCFRKLGIMNNQEAVTGNEKKVLALCYFPLYPVNFGSAVRNYQVFKHLSTRYKIYVVCPSCQGYENDIDIVFHDVAKRGLKNWVFDFRLVRFMLSLIRREKIEVLFQRDMYCGFYALLLHVLTGLPLYVDKHSVEFARVKSMGNPYWRVLKIFEKIVCRSAEGIFCVSELDRQLVLRSLTKDQHKIQVIENGFELDNEKYKDLDLKRIREDAGVKPDEKTILFFGNLYFGSNVEAVRIIFDHIIPRIEGRIEYKVWIVGKGDAGKVADGRSHPKVCFLGEQPDIYTHILASDLVIVPLISGGGTRLKIVETVAAGRRVLSTNVGAEGIDVDMTGNILFIEDDWDSFARKIIDLVHISECHPRVPEDFVRQFRWTEIARKINF